MLILVICLCICVCVIQIYYFIKLKKLKSENRQLEQSLSYEKQQYQKIAKVNKSLKYVKHDLEKYMNVVREIEADEDLGNLTKDDLINRIIIMKKREALSRGIRFTHEKPGSISLPLTDSEIIRLFTNVLDNAIEAAQMCSFEPFISVYLGAAEAEDKVCLEVVNSKMSEQKPLEANMATTKADTEAHGYGTRIIGEIIDKYAGAVEYSDRGDEFYVRVLI